METGKLAAAGRRCPWSPAKMGNDQGEAAAAGHHTVEHHLFDHGGRRFDEVGGRGCQWKVPWSKRLRQGTNEHHEYDHHQQSKRKEEINSGMRATNAAYRAEPICRARAATNSRQLAGRRIRRRSPPRSPHVENDVAANSLRARPPDLRRAGALRPAAKKCGWFRRSGISTGQG